MKWFWWVAVITWSLTPRMSVAFTWSDIVEPAPGMPRAIGSYTAGCVQGAVPLPLEGPGFQTMRPSRRRLYGHPALIRYIHGLGDAVAQRGLGVVAIGDLGQPRGGPMLSGHRSHQIGLDVDIWFWIPPLGRVLPAAERDMVAAPSMLTSDRRTLDRRHWSARQADMLRLAVGFDVVARVFVHPIIKKSLCEQFPGAPWLQKLRPWWGHDDHFHVRLLCPTGESVCHNQDLPPAGDGCGAELAWWFSEEARQPPPRVDRAEVPLPAACEDILRR